MQDLVRLGLEPSPARIYVHLHLAGPSRASEIARTLRINRGECYRALHRLVEQGLGRTSVSRPAVFSAVSPERLFNELSDHYQTRGQRVRDAEHVMRPMLEQAAGQRPNRPRPSSLRTIVGRHEAYRAAAQMVRAAKRSIRWIDAADETGAHDVHGRLWRLARQRAADGLLVRCLITKDARTPASAVQTRRLESTVRMSLLVIDDAETLTGVVLDARGPPQGEEDAYLACDSPTMALAMATLFDGLWSSRPESLQKEPMVSATQRTSSQEA